MIPEGDAVQCEICGRDTRVSLTNMEGAQIYVCSICNPTGEGRIKQSYPKYEGKSTRQTHTPFKFSTTRKFDEKKEERFDLTNYEVVSNYAELIHKERENRKLSIEDFAKELYLPMSFVHKVERGELKPTNNLLLRLFSKFGLVLVQKKEKTQQEKERFVQHNKEYRNNKYSNNQFNRNKQYPKQESTIFVYKPEIETPQKDPEPVEMNNRKKLVL